MAKNQKKNTALSTIAPQAYVPTETQMDQFYGATPEERNDRLGIATSAAPVSERLPLTQPDYSMMSKESLDRMNPNYSPSTMDKIKSWWNSLQEKPTVYDGSGRPVMGKSALDASSDIAGKAFLGQKLMQDQYEKENQMRANQSASQGPQMLDMIHKIYGQNTEAQQRSSALSALAGR